MVLPLDGAWLLVAQPRRLRPGDLCLRTDLQGGEMWLGLLLNWVRQAVNQGSAGLLVVDAQGGRPCCRPAGAQEGAARLLRLPCWHLLGRCHGGLGGCPKGGGGPGRCCTRRGGAPALVEDGGLPAGLQLLLVRGKFGEGGMGLGC